LSKPEHVGVVVPPVVGDEEKPVREAEQRKRDLEQQQRAAEEQGQRAAGTRAKIAALLEQAKTKEQNARPAVPAEDVVRAETEQKEAGDEGSRLRDLLAEAELRKRRADSVMSDIAAQNEIHQQYMAAAAKLRTQASDLEASLAATSIVAPDELDFAAVEASIVEARRHADLVRSVRAEDEAVVKAASLFDELEAAQREAGDLDVIVKRLTTDAVSELAARTQMIPGLTFPDDEDDIALDGYVFHVLSDSERIELCVELAKRLNPKGKLLRVNGLEQFDDDSLEDFVRMATRDGWQMIGTRVERGELRIVAIEPNEPAEEKAKTPGPEPRQSQLQIVMPDEKGAQSK
jgi:hypothetical protein